MGFPTVWSHPTLYQVTSIAVGLTVPMLTVLAFRGWAKQLRKDLPPWRNVLGVISMSSTLLSWVGFISLFLIVALRFHTHVHEDVWLSVVLLMVVTGISLAVTLRGASRFQTLLAGLLMVALWLMSIVH